jgi:sec-independent protein translocase protein TatC
MFFWKKRKREVSEDLFEDTRMPFGEHIEVLRWHLIRAIAGLLFCMIIGFVLDLVGYAVGDRRIGIGRPVSDIIKAPVSAALEEFFDTRVKRLEEDAERKRGDALFATAPQLITITIPQTELEKLPGIKGDTSAEPIKLNVQMSPLDIWRLTNRVETRVRPRELVTLSATETMMVYFKVSLLCGLILASPWVFIQIWSFIAAGLYPHEKYYVNTFLPFSVGLFITGVLVCQFLVMPRTVSALLWFNDFLGFTPDLRLNEWLSLAIMLPLIFGICFQTPLVMLFLVRLGFLDIDAFRRKRKIAIIVMAIIAAIVTPTPDIITMMFLLIPMTALYELGILLCKYTIKREPDEIEEPDSEEWIGV